MPRHKVYKKEVRIGIKLEDELKMKIHRFCELHSLSMTMFLKQAIELRLKAGK